jgi:hypothetical protein
VWLNSKRRTKYSVKSWCKTDVKMGPVGSCVVCLVCRPKHVGGIKWYNKESKYISLDFCLFILCNCFIYHTFPQKSSATNTWKWKTLDTNYLWIIIFFITSTISWPTQQVTTNNCGTVCNKTGHANKLRFKNLEIEGSVICKVKGGTTALCWKTREKFTPSPIGTTLHYQVNLWTTKEMHQNL